MAQLAMDLEVMDQLVMDLEVMDQLEVMDRKILKIAKNLYLE
jgi:hypothetical protein